MIGLFLVVLIVLVALVLLGKVSIILLAHPGVLLGGGLIALAFLLLVALGLTHLSFNAHPQAATVLTPAPPPVVQVPQLPQPVQQFGGYSEVQTIANGPTWVKTSVSMWLILVIGFVVAIVGRRIFHPVGPRAPYRFWPVLLLIPVLFVFWFGSVRYQVHVQSNPSFDESIRRTTEEMTARGQHVAQRATERAEQLQRNAQSRMHKAELSIQEEIDQFDAPRIPISAEVPAFARMDAKSPGEAQLAASAPAAPQAPDAPAEPAKAKPPNDSTNKREHKSASKSSSAKTRTKSKKSDEAPPKSAKVNETAVQSEEDNTADADDTVAQTEPPKPTHATKTVAKKAIETTPANKSDNVAAARPAWLNEPPRRSGDVRREVVKTEEYESEEECLQAANIYLMLKTYEHIQQLVGRPYLDTRLPSITFHNGMILGDGNVISQGPQSGYWSDYRLRSLNDINIDVEYIRRQIVAKDPSDNEPREYLETVDRSIGPMKKLYTQIEFTPAIDRELHQQWNVRERQERFGVVGAIAVCILGAIGSLFAMLRIDTLTKGYYTKRLFLGVPVVIIGIVLLLFYLDKYTSLL